MGLGTDRISQTDETPVSRRAILRSGAVVGTGSYLARTGIETASAQTDDNWPAQGYDPENTRYTAETVPLRTDPTVLAEVDIPAGQHADYLLTSSVAYLHGAENGVGAVHTETGELLWQFNPGEGPVIPEGTDGNEILARDRDGTVYAIDMDTGDPTAEIPVGRGYGLGYNGTGQWFAPVSGGRIVSGEVGSPDVTWDTSVEGVPFRPAVTGDDSRVLVSTVTAPPSSVDLDDPESVDAEGRLYALDATDGSVLWESSRVGAGFGSPAIRNGQVYWAGADGDILTHNVETGDRVWEFKTSGSFPRSPAVTTNAVLAGNRDGYLYGVDVDTGEQIGRLPVGAPISAHPVVVDDVVYLGTETGSVYAFEYGGEGQLWEFDAGASVRSLAPGNDRVVVGTEAGYYLLSGDGPPADGSAASTTHQADSGGDEAPTGGDAADVPQRGLFSNGGDEPDAVSNPFNLTMLGFLLSVVGIVHQMFQGR
ncbi:outer membrane protein assembly factor BamB family protein [Halobellus sp. GM3]|uniref:outer membrane protein assembly factor BamB family protein n=1 Tax=Halobellus sp. GM3 TaxID=3458410 RepID=UPI00403DEED6